MSVGLSKKHIKETKVIGKSDGQDLTLLTTYGGLKIIVMLKNDKPEIVGAGAHIATAQFEAEKKLKTKIEGKD